MKEGGRCSEGMERECSRFWAHPFLTCLLALLQAALYAQAADFNKTARFYYMKAQDAYYLANAQASYDDWRRARRQWDYFYR